MAKGKGLKRTTGTSLTSLVDRFGRIRPEPKDRDVPTGNRKRAQRESMQRAR